MRFMSPADLSKPLPISVGLSGGSGTGKTFSALRLARGIATELAGAGAPFGVVDTENRRALHYRDTFPEMLSHYIDFGPEEDGKLVGYSPERWIAMLDFVEASGAAALVVDSLSHAWEGVGGVLDLQAEILGKLGGGERNNLRAWAQIKPRYRKFVNRLIQSSVPVILCSRAKPTIIDPKTGKNAMPTKTRRDDVPWDVAGDKDLLFEMTIMAILDPQHPGCPLYQIKVPDQFKAMLPRDRPLTEDTGRELARWSRDQTSATANKALMDSARLEAGRGTAAMAAWWKSRSPAEQSILLPIRDELKATAQKADLPAEDQRTFFDRPAEHGAAEDDQRIGDDEDQPIEDVKP